jgi:phosphatidylglycerophosphate synthase
MPATGWKTKPSDRSVLRWIKVHLSARVTLLLVRARWVSPSLVTVASFCLAVAAGVVLGLGEGWVAALLAAASQVLDGVDGQLARLSGRVSPGGAFLDSVLDRYGDGALVAGATVYAVRLGLSVPGWVLAVVGILALIGSNSISFSTSRAAELGLDLGRPTLASKGTRTTVMVIAALGTLLWPPLPAVALGYLALHTNAVVVSRLVRTSAGPSSTRQERPT